MAQAMTPTKEDGAAKACYCCSALVRYNALTLKFSSDRYENIIIDAGRSSMSSTAFLLSEDFVTLLDLAAEAREQRDKKYITLPGFAGAKDFGAIRRLVRHCNYPELEASPSGQLFLPTLLLRRCWILVRKPPRHFHYRAVLRELDLVESRWIDFLSASQHHLLFYMQTLCQIKLRQFADAAASLAKAEDALEDAGLSEADAAKRREKLKIGRENIEKNKAANLAAPDVNHGWADLELSATNPKYPALSDAATVVQIGSGGVRKKAKENVLGIAASRRIEPGEVIALEKPAVVRQFDNAFGLPSSESCCHECLDVTLHLLPCPGCCLVGFCSLECRDAALNGAHRYECVIGLAHIGLAGGNDCQRRLCLALRYIFGKPLSFFEERADVFSPAKSVNVREDCSFLNLFHHGYEFDQTSRQKTHATPADALFGIWLLRASGYLDACDDDKKEPSEILMLNVLGYLIRLLVGHATEIGRPHDATLAVAADAFSPAPPISCHGVGVYPTISLAGHSCLSNAFIVVVAGGGGNRLALVAASVILPGDKVTIAHGCNFLVDSLAVRKVKLASLGIGCGCLACAKGWGGPATERQLRKTMKNVFSCRTYVEKYYGRKLQLRKEKKFDSLVALAAEESAEMHAVLPWDQYQVWRDIHRCVLFDYFAVKYHSVFDWQSLA